MDAELEDAEAELVKWQQQKLEREHREEKRKQEKLEWDRKREQYELEREVMRDHVEFESKKKIDYKSLAVRELEVAGVRELKRLEQLKVCRLVE